MWNLFGIIWGLKAWFSLKLSLMVLVLRMVPPHCTYFPVQLFSLAILIITAHAAPFWDRYAAMRFHFGTTVRFHWGTNICAMRRKSSGYKMVRTKETTKTPGALRTSETSGQGPIFLHAFETGKRLDKNCRKYLKG